MENALLFILLLMLGGLFGVIFVLGIIRSMRGLITPGYGVPPVYRDDYGTRGLTDWVFIFVILMVVGVAYFNSDKLVEVLQEEASLAAPKQLDQPLGTKPPAEYNPPVPLNRGDQLLEQDTLPIPAFEDIEEEWEAEDKDYPLEDFLTEEYWFIQYSASGILGFVEAEVEKISETEGDMVFIGIEDGKYKILSGPYFSEEEVKEEARGCKLPHFIRKGKQGLDLFEGYYEEE